MISNKQICTKKNRNRQKKTEMLSMMLFLRTPKNSKDQNNLRSKQRIMRLLERYLTYLLLHPGVSELFHLLLECHLFRLLLTFLLHQVWELLRLLEWEFLHHQEWVFHLLLWVEFLLLRAVCRHHLVKVCPHHPHQVLANHQPLLVVCLLDHLAVCHRLLLVECLLVHHQECLPRLLACQVPQVLLLFQVLCHQDLPDLQER